MTAGGLAVIASVLGILLFLLSEALPLLRSARVTPAGRIPLAASASGVQAAGPGALLVDEHRTYAATLDAAGRVAVYAADGRQVAGTELLDPEVDRARALRAEPNANALGLATSDGRVVLQRIDWRVRFEGARRQVQPELQAPVRLALEGGPFGAFAFALSDDATTVALAGERSGIHLLRLARRENPFTGEVARSETRFVLETDAPVEHLVVGPGQDRLFAATRDGWLHWWDLARPGAATVDAPAPSPTTALSLLIGGRTLVSGHSDGALRLWFPLRRGPAGAELVHVREFDTPGGAVRHIAPSPRDHGFLALREGGGLGLYYSTSHRVLWEGPSPVPDASALAYAPKGDGAALASASGIARVDIANPHPEVSLESLFAPLWYEDHPEPAFVWQSTGGSDEFESKLSLTPLLLGTLKGTFYSLLLAVPLGILGGLYTSQFLHPSLQRVTKPTIELMASLPSVVLGFLAGLWLAPRLEQAFPTLLLMLLLLPLSTLLAGWGWSQLPRRVAGRLPAGTEIVPHAFALVATGALCIALGPGVERMVFSGDFSTWLASATGLAYDQRNAVVVGLAMGFAVIPIVFSISEDAFTSVPASLAAGSLALGASRWQTVTRIVLPAASPGLFAAVMIGFGRAVGETMIVLMATGNTPILDWDPFSGFRTLSANIAVEIPEAPHGGTLYRVLFVAALLLFAVTFVINTASELVRQRLRARFGRF